LEVKLRFCYKLAGRGGIEPRSLRNRSAFALSYVIVFRLTTAATLMPLSRPSLR